MLWAPGWCAYAFIAYLGRIHYQWQASVIDLLSYNTSWNISASFMDSRGIPKQFAFADWQSYKVRSDFFVNKYQTNIWSFYVIFLRRVRDLRRKQSVIHILVSSSHISTLFNIHHHINGLVQERRNSSANALELRLSCTNPLITNFPLFCQ